jgi:hypothetical protein
MPLSGKWVYTRLKKFDISTISPFFNLLTFTFTGAPPCTLTSYSTNHIQSLLHQLKMVKPRFPPFFWLQAAVVVSSAAHFPLHFAPVVSARLWHWHWPVSDGSWDATGDNLGGIFNGNDHGGLAMSWET